MYVRPPTFRILSSAVHIDTVKLSHGYRTSDLPSPTELERKKFDVHTMRRDGKTIITGYLRSGKRKSTEPRLTVITNSDGLGWINAEVSLAKLINGNGLGKQTNNDIECGLGAIEDFIRQMIGVAFNARTAKVNRLDVNADFKVGEKRIEYYVNTISCHSSTLVKRVTNSTTVQFDNKSRKLMAYGKKRQMEYECKNGRATSDDVKLADGVLRVESGLITNQTINRFAKKQSCPAEADYLLRLNVALSLVSKTLSEMGLNMPKHSMHKLHELLVESFGKDAPKMLGILEWRKSHGEDFWKKLGWSQSTYTRRRDELVLANLWDVSPDEELPPLGVYCKGFY